jgi:hypothetical protein
MLRGRRASSRPTGPTYPEDVAAQLVDGEDKAVGHEEERHLEPGGQLEGGIEHLS